MKFPFPLDEKNKLLTVIVETPKGSRNKYAFDKEHGLFRLKKVLPSGMSFPYDFGFVPYTEAEDGDPLDALIITDASTFPGCVVECLLLGVMKMEQEKEKKMVRNDRLIAVHANSREYTAIQKLRDLSPALLKEMVLFFKNYTQSDGSRFKHSGYGNADTALKIIKETLKGKVLR